MGRRKGGHYQKLRYLDGRRAQKWCQGPLHRGGDGGGSWVDVSEFYLNRSGRLAGRLRSWCKACDSYSALGRHARNVPSSLIAFAVEELVRRLGVNETTRRLFKSQQWLYQFRKGRIDTVRHDTAVDIVLLLADVRARGEVRSKTSIRRGATMRGEEEKRPSGWWDFYRPSGDSDQAARARTRATSG